jgi:salicylate hydroxylase
VHLRSDRITVWMGPRLHVVQYPVQAGRALNLVAIVHGDAPVSPEHWDHSANANALLSAMDAVGPDLRTRLEAVPHWGLWALHERAPMSSAGQMAQGRVALLGDAAHPMRPYLAQGAGMAIEDAEALGACLMATGAPVAERLQRYAEQRWARNARVQARAIRNGQIFHASGAMAVGRNLSMQLMGERLMDQPWLYAA